MSDITITLTGNEARLIFYSIKNKKCVQAENVRRKLIRASEINCMKRAHKEYKNADETDD